MNVSNSEVFFCPSSPQFIWDLKQTISLQLAIAVTAAACPFTILLNILVIVAVKKTRKLQTNSIILITSLAVADLLVGAVSMPLTISIDSLILQGTFSEDICTASDITGFILYTSCLVSYYHLVLIAWERYVAVVKCMEYKAIVTEERLRNSAVIAWIAGLVTITTYGASAAARVPYEVLLVLDFAFGVISLICFSLIVHFYRMIYIKVRKENRSLIIKVSTVNKARVEGKIAYMMFLLTVAVVIFSVPTAVVYIVTTISPIFHANSVYRWAEILLQIHSLVNPALYFYRNRSYRKAVLKLLTFGKPQKIEPVPRTRRRATRRRDSVASIDAGELIDGEKGTHDRRNTCTGREVSANRVMDRRMSTSSLTSRDNLRDAPRSITVTVQIEHAPRKKREKKKKKIMQR